MHEAGGRGLTMEIRARPGATRIRRAEVRGMDRRVLEGAEKKGSFPVVLLPPSAHDARPAGAPRGRENDSVTQGRLKERRPVGDKGGRKPLNIISSSTALGTGGNGGNKRRVRHLGEACIARYERSRPPLERPQKPTPSYDSKINYVSCS